MVFIVFTRSLPISEAFFERCYQNSAIFCDPMTTKNQQFSLWPDQCVCCPRFSVFWASGTLKRGQQTLAKLHNENCCPAIGNPTGVVTTPAALIPRLKLSVTSGWC